MFPLGKVLMDLQYIPELQKSMQKNQKNSLVRQLSNTHLTHSKK